MAKNGAKVFILVPSLDDTSPVKGAVALAGGLAISHDVSLVVLKSVKSASYALNPSVKLVSLEALSGYRKKIAAYRRILAENNGDFRPVSISFCFSADCANLLCKDRAITISSVRADLLGNYPYRYGWRGYPLAILHLFLFRFFDRTLAMSKEMQRQLKRFGIKRVEQIGNFVDEPYLDAFRKNHGPNLRPVTFLFLGALSKRKRPDLLIHSMAKLREENIICRLKIIGDGPLGGPIRELIDRFKMEGQVEFLGYLKEPYREIQDADYLVAPSVSEGISRSILEALYYGLPCIARDIQGTKEVIWHGVNGYLFKRDEDLVSLLRDLSKKSDRRNGSPRSCLLPPSFTYREGIRRHANLIDKITGPVEIRNVEESLCHDGNS